MTELHVCLGSNQFQNNFRLGFSGVGVKGEERATIEFIGSRRAECFFQFRVTEGVESSESELPRPREKALELRGLGRKLSE